MIARLRRSDPGQDLWKIIVFRCTRATLHAFMVIFYRIRIFHAERTPDEGPLLVVANHQSFLDPPIVGAALRDRHIVSLARVGLFKNAFFARCILLLNAIPLKQDEADAAAMRRAVAVVKNGRALLVFGEGARTFNGAMEPLKPGFWLVLKRTKATVLPVAMEGAFDAWPRTQAFPSLFRKRVAVAVGEPIPFDALAAMKPEDGMREVGERIDELRLELRGHLRKATKGRYPPEGPGDEPLSFEPEPDAASPSG